MPALINVRKVNNGMHARKPYFKLTLKEDFVPNLNGKRMAGKNYAECSISNLVIYVFFAGVSWVWQ